MPNAVDDAKPRMTAEEADARFAALVAQHRGEKKPRGRGIAASVSRTTVVLAAVYLAGVAAAWVFRKAPAVSFLVGVVVVVVARFVLAKDATSDDA